MAQYNTPQDLLDMIAALEKRVRTLETVANLHAASIDAGDLTIQAGGSLIVKNNNGSNLVRIGRDDVATRVLPDGSKQSNLVIRRQDGTVALAVFDPAPLTDGFNQFIGIYDRGESLIMSDDTTSGQGLARPYIPVVFQDYQNFPTSTTTNATFTSLMFANHYKQHPKMYLAFFARCSDATTSGEIQIWDQNLGVQIGSTIVMDPGDYIFNGSVIDIAGAHMSTQALHIRGRRTAGAGTVGVKVIQAYGIQS